MRSMLCTVAAGAVAALSASVHAQTVPAYSVQTRWVVNTAIPAGGATSITLTLQGRAIFDGAFPADTDTVRYGNFGLFAMGFGPGQADISRISRTDSSVILRRGDWGSFQTGVDELGNPIFSGELRGAAPGDYNAVNHTFSRSMRFLSGQVGVPELPPDPNLPGPIPPAAEWNAPWNGAWDAAGNMFNFNLLRGDFQSSAPHARDLADPAGGPAWQDVYRLRIDTATPVIIGPGGLTVDFTGWLRAAGRSGLVGGNWTLSGGNSVPSSASISFTAVPSPAACTLLALGLASAARRRR